MTNTAAQSGAKATLASSGGRRAVIAQVTASVITSQALTWFLIVVSAIVAQAAGARTIGGYQIAWAVILLAVAGVSEGVAAIISDRSTGRESARIHRLVLGHCFRLGPAAFTGEQTGEAVSMMTDGVERVAGYRQGFIGPTIGSVLSPALILISVAIAIDPLSAGVLLICIPFVPLAVGGFQSAFRKVSAASRDARSKLAADFLTAIQGLTTLVLLRAADRVGDRLADTGEANRRATMSLLARNQLILFITDTAFSLFMVSASAALAFWRLDSGMIDAGQAIALVLIATLLSAPVDKIGGFFYIGMAGLAMQRQILEFLRRPVPVRSTAETTTTDAAVEMRELGFGYTAENPILDGVTMRVPKRTRTAIFGPSGSGKSTLISVLCGDLIPQRGVCLVDGVPLDAGTQDEVRARSALMRQHTWLFVGSMAENLRIGNPEATDAELWQALDRVALGDWTRRLPDGLDTQLGERGMAVSGGQAQRISLARAMLSGRGLLLLDEPTSQVDLESEQIIWAAVDELAADHTIVMATHRASAAHHADQVLAMTGAGLNTAGEDA